MEQTVDNDLIDTIFKKNETLTGGAYEFEEYVFNYKDIMHSVGFFGGSESGKTFLCKDMISRVKGIFPRVILFSPTAATNNDFKGIINDLLIIPTLTEEKFIEIYDAQKEIANMFRKVNSFEVLQEVFEGSATSSQKNNLAKIINAKERLFQFIRSENTDENIAAEKIRDMNVKIEKKMCKYMKAIILSVRHTLPLDEFSADGKLCIKYLDIQPRTLIIFDDLMDECSAMLKKSKSKASMYFKNLFTKGRHDFITHWHILQDDAPIPPTLRKNLKVSVLTKGDVANSYITRISNGISPIDKKFGLALIDKLFQGESDHRKIFYFKDKSNSKKFQYFTAKHAGLFCSSSSIINKFCDSLIKN